MERLSEMTGQTKQIQAGPEVDDISSLRESMHRAKHGTVKEKFILIENTVTAKPRVRLSNMSENTAATQVKGQAPKKPAQKRQMITVCRSFPTATAKLKIAKPNEATTIGSRRPYSSEKGAQKMGPVATSMRSTAVLESDEVPYIRERRVTRPTHQLPWTRGTRQPPSS